MKRSKPGKALAPVIKVWTDRIYYRDIDRYDKLCLWVWVKQKDGWEDEAIAKALSLAETQIDKVENWRNYLDKLLPKAKGRATEDESEQYKKGDLTKVKAILKKLKE
jgi:hypothetical protein